MVRDGNTSNGVYSYLSYLYYHLKEIYIYRENCVTHAGRKNAGVLPTVGDGKVRILEKTRELLYIERVSGDDASTT